MSYDDNEAGILAGGGGERKPKVLTPPVGGTLAGVIVGAWESQSRKWDRKLQKGVEPVYWGDDGKPTTTVTDRPVIDQFVVLQAYAPDGDDDGRRSFCLTSKAKVRNQRKLINQRQGGLALNGHLTVSRPEADRPDRPGDMDSQQLVLTYRTPEETTLMGDGVKPESAAPKSTATDENPFA